MSKFSISCFSYKFISRSVTVTTSKSLLEFFFIVISKNFLKFFPLQMAVYTDYRFLRFFLYHVFPQLSQNTYHLLTFLVRSGVIKVYQTDIKSFSTKMDKRSTIIYFIIKQTSRWRQYYAMFSSR